MTSLQGGDPSALDDFSKLPHASIVQDYVAPASGVLARVDADGIGRASLVLGGGRQKTDDGIDPAVGLTNPMPDDTLAMWNRNYADYHRRTGMTVMGSSSLAEGFFSDPDNERFAGTMYDSGAAHLLAKKILCLSQETGLTPAQICIRFQTDYPGIQMIPTFSASTEKNLREICSSFDRSFPEDALFRF